MKTVEIENERRPLTEWLPSDDSEEVIYLTRAGRARFVLVPLDEGDEEVLAVRNNKKLMAAIESFVERGQKGPRKSLNQIRAQLGAEKDDGAPQ